MKRHWSAWFALGSLLAASAAGCAYDAITFKQGLGGGDAGPEQPQDHENDAATKTTAGEDAGVEPDDEDAGDGEPTTRTTLDAADSVMAATIEPLYPWAPKLGQYVRTANPTQACSTSAPDRTYDTCFDAGAWRVIRLPAETSCSGIEIESAEYTSWHCVLVDEKVELHSQIDDSLESWVALEKGVWRTEQVDVLRKGTLIARTEPQALWANAVRVLGAPTGSDPVVLDEPLTVYVLTEAAAGSKLVITADQVTLVGGSRWAPIAGLSTQGTRAFLRVMDMYVEPGASPSAVTLDVVHSLIDNVSSTRSVSLPGSGPDIEIGCDASRIAYVAAADPLDLGMRVSSVRCDVEALTVERAPAGCLELSAIDTEIHPVVLQHCGGVGLKVSGLVQSTLRNVSVMRAKADAVQVLGSKDSLVQRVEAVDNGGHGVLIDTLQSTATASRNVTLLDVESTNNGGHGVLLRGTDLRAVKLLSAANDLDGVHVDADTTLVAHVTASQNVGAGVRVVSGEGNTLVNLVSVNNALGLALDSGSALTTARTAFTVDNDLDLSVAGSDHSFAGDLWLSSATACDVDAAAVNPGLMDTPACAGDTGSAVTLHAPTTSVGAFAGRLPSGDRYNATFVDADGSVLYEDIEIDYFEFPFRHYGTDAGTYPSANARGRCGPGERCAVWDWQVTKVGPLINYVGSDPAAYVADPARALQHTWSAATQLECAVIRSAAWDAGCRSELLDCAYEQYLSFYSLGHFVQPPTDNGLCEAGELCVLAPNLGAYPGSGATASLDASGHLGTSFERYLSNGR